jgi:hypothetical protein
MEKQIQDYKNTTDNKDKRNTVTRKLIISLLVALFAGIMGFIGGFIAISYNDVLNVKAIYLKDNDGKPKIVLRDKHGKGRIVFAIADDKPLIAIVDENGKLRLSISPNNDDNQSIIIYDKLGNNRLSISLNKDEEPSIDLYDKLKNARLSLGSVYLVKEKTGTEIKRPASSLVLFNEKGNVIWKAPIDD